MRQKSKKNGQVDGFIFRREWATMLRVMGDRARGAVLRAIVDYYVRGSDYPLAGSQAQRVFNIIKADMDAQLGISNYVENYDGSGESEH